MNADDYHQTLCSIAQIDGAIMTMMTIRMTLAAGAQAAMPPEARTVEWPYGVFIVCSYTDGESAYIGRLCASMTVAQLQIEVELATGVPVAEQRLFHGSNELVAAHTLAQAGVDKDATIWLCRTLARPISMENLPSYLKF